MKKNKGKLLSGLIVLLSIIAISLNTYAHSGRTDGSGGHKDNKNKSGLGSYHYHCGGHPAHLHPNGICPYSSNKKSTSSSSSKKSTSSSSTSKKTTTVYATKIKINENVENIRIGDNQTLTATITPSNATDKSITWKSSDENIATINSEGKIVAKNSGTVDITVSTSNGKTNTIKIDVQEGPKKEMQNTVKTVATVENSKTSKDVTNNTISNSQDNSDPIGTILALGILGGGGYFGYKKYKKGKQ